MKKFISTILILVLAILVGWGLFLMTQCGQKEQVTEKVVVTERPFEDAFEQISALEARVKQLKENLRIVGKVITQLENVNWLSYRDHRIRSRHQVIIVLDHSGCYIVKEGDTLWGIAVALCGDGSRWRELYELNRKFHNGSVPDEIIHRDGLEIPNLQIGAHLRVENLLIS